MNQRLSQLYHQHLSHWLTRKNLELAALAGILLCILGLFFGRIPRQDSLQLDQGKLVYQGSVLHHKMDGKGTLTFENGDRYEGDFKNGLFEGKGTFTSKDGWVYTGDFKKGLADGTGKLTTENKTIYQGHFKQGIYQHAD